MSRTSKSPRRVALAALAIAQRVLPAYSHPNVPKTFTQPQLLACLVLNRRLASNLCARKRHPAGREWHLKSSAFHCLDPVVAEGPA